MTNKQKQQKRMLKYFIEAAQHIIKTEGLKAVTVRKVSDLAGYNSATLYNYFADLDQLILFASIKQLSQYNLRVIDILKNCDNALEIYYSMWRLFCETSFNSPEEFYQLFFNKHCDSLSEILEKYYEVFPEEEFKASNNITSILLNANFAERNKIPLIAIAEEGGFKWKNLDLINDITISLYKNLLYLRTTKCNSATANEYVELMIDYLDYLLELGKN